MSEKINKLKADLLCLGARVDGETARQLEAEYPHFFDKGFIHAVNLHMRDVNINISVAEEFSGESPYLLTKRDGVYRITGNGWDEPIVFYRRLPETGTVVDELARLHSSKCINIWPSTTCCYDTPELKCRFCSLKAESAAPLDVEELGLGIRKLLEQLPKGHNLNFSGGTFRDPDWMAHYWISLAREIRRFSDVSITAEFAPPSDLGLLREMKDAGIDVAIMNLEVADPQRRKEICPGKSRISYEHYHEAFREAAAIFGWGMVSSVLIGGIQPKEEIMRECAIMAEEGVFPTVMPFRPMDDCELYGFRRCEPSELLEMAEYLGTLLQKYKLDYRKQPGCTECGGCSLENDCYRKLEQKESV